MSNGQLRSIVDRILRLKSEQDDLAKDIREIYAEAKSNGFDKTALGKVVSHVRKREKLGADQMAEVESVFDTYLHAYLGTGIAHAHTHETEPHPPVVSDQSAEANTDAQSLPAFAPVADESDGRSGDESPVNNSEHTDSPSTTGINEPAEMVANGANAGGCHEVANDHDTHLETGCGPVKGRHGASREVSGSAVETGASTIVQFNRDETTEERCLRLRPHCLNPSACAGVGNNHCFGCRKAVTSMTGESA